MRNLKYKITLRQLLYLMDSDNDGTYNLKINIDDEDNSFKVASDCALYLKDEILDSVVDSFDPADIIDADVEIWLWDGKGTSK